MHKCTECQPFPDSAVNASTSVTGGNAMVVVGEGRSVNISCTSTGVPVPTISWTLHGQPAPFTQRDVSEDVVVTVQWSGSAHTPVVTPGRVTSSLPIERAKYPAHDGVYACTGTNSHAGVSSTSTVMITVQVQGTPIQCCVMSTAVLLALCVVVPEVDLTADRTRVGLGGAVTLTCNVTRANPIPTYTWTNVDISTTLSIIVMELLLCSMAPSL